MKRARHFLSAGTSKCIIALAADRAEMSIHFLWNITGSPLWRHCKIWHRAGVELPEREQTAEERQQADARVTLRDMNKEAAVYFHYLLKSERGAQALSYLKNRGLSDETINHFGLGYADIYRDDLYQYLRSKGFTDYQMKESSLVNLSLIHI